MEHREPPQVEQSAGISARRAPSWVCTARVHGLLVLAAVLLGVYADLGTALPGFWLMLAEIATPWATLAYLAGRLTTTNAAAATLAGAAYLSLALLSYYAWLALGMHVSVRQTLIPSFDAPTWLLAGAGVGAGFGLLGGLSHSRRGFIRTGAWAGLAAVPLVDTRFTTAGWYEAVPTFAVDAALIALAVGLLVTGRRIGRAGWPSLILGTLAASAVLWEAETMVLRHLLHWNI